MGWIDQKPPRHVCPTPSYGDWPYNFDTESKWRCDDCGQIWVFKTYMNLPYWDALKEETNKVKRWWFKN